MFFPRSSTNPWKFPIEIVEIAPGLPDEVLGFAIHTVEVVHQSGAPSTAVRLMQDGKVLSYSGDTKWTDALIPIADGADLFIVECYNYDRRSRGHMSFSDLRKKRGELRARRIMLTHMNPTMLARLDKREARGSCWRKTVSALIFDREIAAGSAPKLNAHFSRNCATVDQLILVDAYRPRMPRPSGGFPCCAGLVCSC